MKKVLNNLKVFTGNMLVLIALLLSSVSANAGGDLVNNGGGLAEKNVMYAYQKLDSYLRLCLGSAFCKIDTEQKVILEQILAGLPQEKENANQIKFASEKNQPGFFIIDGEVKVAKTGSKVGSPIYINTDLIYTKNEMGFYIPASISEAVAILVHELGHHYGSYDHGDLDLLGIRVAMMLQHKTYNTPLLPWSQQVSATVINPDVNESFPDILLNVEDQVLDLSQKFKDAVICPKFVIPIPILPIPDIPVYTKKPLGTLVHNVHWDKMSVSGNKANLRVSADLSHKCKSVTEEGVIRSQDYQLEINFSLSADESGKWFVDKDSVKVEQKSFTWWKILKFSSR